MAAPAGEPPVALPPVLGNFRDVAALVAGQREPRLHGHLVHSVHLVRFAPPVIELRPQPDAPRDLAARLAAVLTEATGTRWTIALSTAEGEPTLAAQGVAADSARRSAAAEHPLVRTILETFPGARIEAVHDSRTDSYGLLIEPPAEIVLSEQPPPTAEELEFAPLDAEFVDDPSEYWEPQS